MTRQPGLFDLDARYAALSKNGDPLERLSAVVDFEMFRADLDAALKRSDRNKGGRLPMDAVLIVQALYGLADERTEFQIRDRLSFMRFLGLDLLGAFPMPARSGCSASNSPRPGPSMHCLPVSTRICATVAISPWVAR